MQVDLRGQWALVGGASQGIGQATAKVLAEAGARIILMSRRQDVLESVRNTLPDPSSHRCFAVDAEKTQDLSLGLARVVNETGPVSIWVNNTGGPKAGPLADASSDELERAFRGHVVASQMILRALLPGMKQNNYGRIVNILSTSVKTPLPNLGVSNIMRAGVASWAKTLSVELGPFGITVNSVLPGYTETPRLESLITGAASKTGKSADEVRQGYIDSIPVRRLADPEETAAAIAFLASPLAGYISGTVLPVDGARTPAL